MTKILRTSTLSFKCILFFLGCENIECLHYIVFKAAFSVKYLAVYCFKRHQYIQKLHNSFKKINLKKNKPKPF